jgi:hypothetical protein
MFLICSCPVYDEPVADGKEKMATCRLVELLSLQSVLPKERKLAFRRCSPCASGTGRGWIAPAGRAANGRGDLASLERSVSRCKHFIDIYPKYYGQNEYNVHSIFLQPASKRQTIRIP